MSAPTIVSRTTPWCTPQPANTPHRRILGVVLHHTGGNSVVPCHSNGSWHWQVGRDGTLYADVQEQHVAWHTRACDRWRPLWMTRGCSWANVSEPNTSTIGIEIVSAAGSTPITDEQHASMRWLTAQLHARYGDLWYVGHGELQTDRRLSEPDNLDHAHCGLGEFVPGYGRSYIGTGDANVTDAEKDILAAVLETGYPASEAAALIRQFAGLHANTASVSLWINQIGALESEVARLTGEAEQHENVGVPNA